MSGNFGKQETREMERKGMKWQSETLIDRIRHDDSRRGRTLSATTAEVNENAAGRFVSIDP